MKYKKGDVVVLCYDKRRQYAAIQNGVRVVIDRKYYAGHSVGRIGDEVAYVFHSPERIAEQRWAWEHELLDSFPCLMADP